MAIEEILLDVALGHSLRRSLCLLAALPTEVVQKLASEIRKVYDEDLVERGLSTPVDVVPLVILCPTLRRPFLRFPPTLPRPKRVCEPFAAPWPALMLADFGTDNEDPVASQRRLDEDCDRVLQGSSLWRQL
jgi:hypothetical protein